MTSNKDLEFEAAIPEAPVDLSISVDLEGLGISLINTKIHELAYFSLRGFSVKYADTAISQDVKVSCKWIQIDNQL